MVNKDIQDGVCVVRVIKVFTLDDVHEIINAVEESGKKAVILDMTHLEMLTSSAIGLLISVYNNLKEIHIKMGVSGLNSNNRQLFSLSKMDKLFSVFETVDQGIGVFKGTTV